MVRRCYAAAVVAKSLRPLGMGSWRVLSGEWMLLRWPNGGSVVFWRAAWIAFPAFLVSVLCDEWLRSGAGSRVDTSRVGIVLGDHLPWFGAIFAGVYAGLYSRFASQWKYLANLYNQLMLAQVQFPPDTRTTEQQRLLATWKAGFIEDAQDLHLATKPMYAAVVRSMLADPDVRKAFVTYTKDGAVRLEDLERAIAAVLPLTQDQ